MTGKRYYLTTLGAWHRHAARLVNSHWLALANIPTTASGDITTDDAMPPSEDFACAPNITPAGTACCAPTELTAHANVSPLQQRDIAPDDITPILVLVEADEGEHLVLEDDVAFEALPHPLAQKPISETAQTALAAHGVVPGATTFDAAEAVARVHPLLRHRVF